MKGFIAALMVATCIGSVSAAENGTYSNPGSPQVSCAEYDLHVLKDEKDSPYTLVPIAWVMGFLNGAGYSSEHSDPLKDQDFGKVLVWVIDYCLANPEATIEKAAKDFMTLHTGKRT